MKILDAIETAAVNTTDLLDVILSSSYGASYGKLNREFLKKQREGESKSLEKRLRREARQKYYNLIYYLKKGGLVEERQKQKSGKKFFILTNNGREKLFRLKQRSREKLPEVSYPKESGDKFDKFVIVIFDIPEKERGKRDWLRFALNNMGLKMVQKSVWMGKIKIPREFLGDLLKLKLLDFVEIFEISKTGSLEKRL